MALLSFLDRERSVAHPGYSRWLVPPAALAIHLAIGQVYSFSVFKIPLTQVIGIAKSGPDDWTQSQVAWIFSLAIVMLGLSAALFGKWLETAGPRKAMFVAACCFGLGFFISYLESSPTSSGCFTSATASSGASDWGWAKFRRSRR
jgi:MFS family permease